MKKIVIALLSLLFLIAIGVGVLQSSWSKNKILSFLTKSLKESGWQIKTETINSLFPHLSLNGLQIETEELIVSVESLQADFSFLRLLKKEIAFKNVQGEGVSWEPTSHLVPIQELKIEKQKRSFFELSIPNFTLKRVSLFEEEAEISGSLSAKETRKGDLKIRSNGMITFGVQSPWDFSIQILRNPNQTWRVDKLNAQNNIFTIKSSGNLDAKGSLTHAQADIQSNQLSLSSPVALSGRLFAHIDLEGKDRAITAKATWRIPVLKGYSYEAKEVHGNIEALYSDGMAEGNASLHANFLQHQWESSALFSWEKGSSLMLSQLKVMAPPLDLQGDLEITPNRQLIGQLGFTSSQLHDLYPPFYGKAEGKIVWEIYPEQMIHVDATASDFYWNTFFAKTISIYSDLGAIDSFFIDLEKAKWGSLFLDSASLETTRTQKENPFKLFAEGTWNHPLVLELDGLWDLHDDAFSISLQTATGSFFNHPILLTNPTQFQYSPSIFRLEDLSLAIGNASITSSMIRDQENTDATIKITELPLDILSLNPLDVPIVGLLNLDAKIQEINGRLQGNLSAAIDQMSIQIPGQTPIYANGILDGHFNKQELNFKGRLNVKESPLVEIALSLPIAFEIWPFKAQIIDDKPLNGHLLLSGHVEEFLDFLNLGTHRLEGLCNCDLSLSHTFANPFLTGSCTFEDGYYQNYYTGTELQNIKAYLKADQNKLLLTSMSAIDAQKKGAFTATGIIKLLPKESFPFHFNLAFSRFNWATFDLITSEAEGNLSIEGNLHQALVKGDLSILESDVMIPNRIPRELPNLHVIYKNLSHPVEDFNLPKATPYPLHLDLQVDAPDGIFISGRGLNSEWKGNFHIQGTQTDLETKGKIELIKGDFIFSGKVFRLTEGSLFFSGTPNEMPQLNLSATIDVKEVSITAQLKGPLNNPQVTFLSSPPLPMGTIMSYLLFGQDLAEINSFQALQLANSIASLSGEGPGVLETTRKSLGIDRIQIITVPSASAEGGETIAVQVGKYVAEGVMVSFSQGAEDSSGNITIDVDIKGGLSLQLASDQAQEQGKFALRWSHTY